MKKILVAVAFLISTVSVEAGGFQVNLQGQKQIGMGDIGTGLLLDGSCILFNPGALCFMNSSTVNVSGSFIFPSTEYLAPTPSNYTSENKSGC